MASRKPVRQAAKRKIASDVENSDSEVKEKKIKNCPKSGCPTLPICFARVASTCCGNGYTSRWYHISAGEHFCNECFEHFYRSHNAGYDKYTAWKRIWSQYGATDNSVKYYMADQLLPYWIQCNLCEKWRSVFRETEITPRYLKNYVCTRVLKNQSQDEACDSPEDYRIEMAKEAYVWPFHLIIPMFVKNAVYAPYTRDFFQDSVGISPSDTSVHKYDEGIMEVRQYLQPFQFVEDNMAMALPPDQLSEDELLYFPEFKGIFLKFYLIIRNTILVLWNLNIKNWVTRERCMNYVIMRGLSRVWITIHVDRILFYLTLKGYINHGVALPAKEIQFIEPPDENFQKHPVIIIGAGLSGLSAARQLTNFSVQVTVLEAGDHIGGRAVDGGSSKFNTQSHMVVGCYNNPIVILCKQADVKVKELGDSCVLLSDGGEIVDDKIDKRMQFHFEAMLDINKQLRKEQDKDISLLDQFTELHNQFKDESGIKFTKLEESLLRFHRSNLEYACGSNLGNISSLFWDQNDEYPQFHGPPVLVQDDFSKVLDKLAKDIQIVKNSPVTSIDYTDEAIKVTCSSGESFLASKVIVTVPLHVLKEKKIEFTPALPEDKNVNLGCGHVEKVMLEFPDKFWSKTVKECGMFGQILSTSTVPGLFDVFYDISQDDRAMLATYISGDAVNILKDKTDEQAVEMCMQTIKAAFCKQTVPEPSNYQVSRWYKSEHIGMSYSYIPTNCEPEAFDNLEKDVNEKIYFAGEATHKQYHQTLAGAYISGLREAEKIYRSLANIT
ncbi:lysine-specific histone demethylase 2-like [Ruditapes philippinarum]|uniref:lysine-specific histone demethylase 2-like n=1 Tax=Ruditapes philippinarum TaxID=129788 RepID=UPI00295C0CF2|nr:lysine-specific histone demethylase 2-like [Ruditapes philippinarum]